MQRMFALVFAGFVTLQPPAWAQSRDIERVNDATFSNTSARGDNRTLMIKTQVLLDRARFSPGVIDGRGGDNTEKAIRAFQQENRLEPTGKLDEKTWQALSSNNSTPVLIEYEIAKEEVNGKFVEKIPDSFEEQAKLKRLAYTGPRELLAEKFHMDDDLLTSLNPKAAFDRAGTKIIVANIDREKPKAKADRVVIDKSARTAHAYDKNGKLLAHYPATIGSEEKPAPSGEFKVRAIAKNPVYTYNPEYEFKGVKSREPIKIAPGPNNPVGTIWIDLTADSYGIHGTPAPANVSKTESHGCIRLTNWDVEELAQMVAKGTPVVFEE
jgi:lipoprotein-anchoring transpeptidase ErfK/SrfK